MMEEELINMLAQDVCNLTFTSVACVVIHKLFTGEQYADNVSLLDDTAKWSGRADIDIARYKLRMNKYTYIQRRGLRSAHDSIDSSS